MENDSSEKIIFKDGLPPKNKFIVGLMFLRWPLFFAPIRWLIKRNLKHCSEVDFIPGFRYFYGRIHAQKVFLSDTFFLDYAPVYIGENTRFSWGNTIITSSHDPNDFETVIAKPVRIGRNVWVTSQCIILPGVTIGDGSIIGAGSVVTKDVPPNCLVAGNPAKIIRQLR